MQTTPTATKNDAAVVSSNGRAVAQTTPASSRVTWPRRDAACMSVVTHVFLLSLCVCMLEAEVVVGVVSGGAD